VIADFDRTLTRAMVNGERGDSCHGVMESLSVLSDEYKAATTALFNKYYPLETCPKLSREEKIPLMQSWYEQAHELLLKEGVRPEQIADAVRGSNITLREGVPEVVAALQVSFLGDAESSLGDATSSRWVTLRARWVTLRARWVALRALAG
jgi:phosphoserine phosphatase